VDPTPSVTQQLLRRLDRLESREAIRQLATEYARLIDAKDLRAVAELFVPDVRVGDAVGREARYEAFRSNHGRAGRFRRTVHLVSGHSIELDPEDLDRATGIAYCRSEHELGDLWVVAAIQYWDVYSRREGKWLFEDRVIQTLYVADVLERPNGQAVKHVLTNTGAASVATLPHASPSWAPFCEAEGIDPDVSRSPG
jgi:ketosteroid isomerase-like protein